MRRATLLVAGALVAFASLAAAPAQAQDRTTSNGLGEWHGVLDTPNGKLTLLFTLRDSAGVRVGQMLSLDQNAATPLALGNVTTSATKLAFTIPTLGANYDAAWSDSAQTWSGTFRQGMALPLILKRGAPPAIPVIEGLDGNWRASLKRDSTTLRLVLRLRTLARGTRITLDSPDLGAMGLDVQGFERQGNAVRFRVPTGDVQFAGTLAADTRSLSGAWTRAGSSTASVTFVRDSAAITRVRTQYPVTPKGYRAEEVSFGNAADSRVTLAGTLTVPEGSGKFPAVVLLTGSGPQDRDETVFGHKTFAVLADYLTRRGIAVLRFDDRGTAKSTGDHGTATSADFATDANAAVRYLRTRSEIDSKSIGFAGHSEGGMIGPIAAVANPDAAFLVLLAGPGTRTDQVLLSQRRLIGLTQGATTAELDRTEPVVRRLMRAVQGARDSASADARVRAELTSSALDTLGVTPAERDAIVAQYNSPWMRYFLRYDPAANLTRLRIPVLAIGGSLDKQVASPENLAAIRTALAKNRDATVRELPGLNHMFQTARTGALTEYNDIPETFAPGAMAIVADWIVQRFPPGRTGSTRRAP